MKWNRRKCQILHLWTHNPKHQDRLEANWLESPFAGKDMMVLVNTKSKNHLEQRVQPGHKGSQRYPALQRKLPTHGEGWSSGLSPCHGQGHLLHVITKQINCSCPLYIQFSYLLLTQLQRQLSVLLLSQTNTRELTQISLALPVEIAHLGQIPPVFKFTFTLWKQLTFWNFGTTRTIELSCIELPLKPCCLSTPLRCCPRPGQMALHTCVHANQTVPQASQSAWTQPFRPEPSD